MDDGSILFSRESYSCSQTQQKFSFRLHSSIKAALPLPAGSEVKASAWNAGDPGSIPGSGRSPGEGNGNPLQYSCLENPMEGEPGRLQSMGSQRVGHDWATSLHFHFYKRPAYLSCTFLDCGFHPDCGPDVFISLHQKCFFSEDLIKSRDNELRRTKPTVQKEPWIWAWDRYACAVTRCKCNHSRVVGFHDGLLYPV